MKIDYDGLKAWLEKLCGDSFKELKAGMSRDDIQYFKTDESTLDKNCIIEYGMPFLVDAIGNDLSVCVLTRRKLKLPTGRVVKMQFIKTIIDDCNKVYGTAINGYWVIPKRFILEA